MAELVYKVSERPGVTRFEPRPFWQLDDFARSGSAVDPAKVPPGARVFNGVYATRESFIPFYFAPRRATARASPSTRGRTKPAFP